MIIQVGIHLLGDESLAKETGHLAHHPGKVGLHLLVGEEEYVLLVPEVPHIKTIQT